MSDWRDNAEVRGIFSVVVTLIWLALRYTPSPPEYASPGLEEGPTAPALRTVPHDPDMPR